jgi:hypothetical protein
VAVVASLAIAASSFLLVALSGCGMEAAPSPPSLQLPKTIPDLAAIRAGNQVHLQWTTPSENTDHLKLKGMVQLRLCRTQQATSPCDTIATISAVPDKPAQYTDVLPPTLTSGPVRPITYRIFGISKHGKTAGPSNVATILAGEAPPEVRDLSAQVVERGVVLHWQPVARAATPKPFNPLPRSTEPVEQKLRVRLIPPDPRHTSATDPGVALDPTAQSGRQYTYSASRVIQQQVGQQTLQLDSSSSPAVQVATRDTFPPAPPSGLVAVPVSAIMNNGRPEVDLSWSANTESDFAQYRVYRRDITSSRPTRPIAPPAGSPNIVAPAYRDLHVQPGQTYTYAVTAVDASGNESHPSSEVTVTVPTS